MCFPQTLRQRREKDISVERERVPRAQERFGAGDFEWEQEQFLARKNLFQRTQVQLFPVVFKWNEQNYWWQAGRKLQWFYRQISEWKDGVFSHGDCKSEGICWCWTMCFNLLIIYINLPWSCLCLIYNFSSYFYKLYTIVSFSLNKITVYLLFSSFVVWYIF